MQELETPPVGQSKFEGDLATATKHDILIAYGFSLSGKTTTYRPNVYHRRVVATVEFKGIGLKRMTIGIRAELHKDGTCDLIAGGAPRVICLTNKQLDDWLRRVCS